LGDPELCKCGTGIQMKMAITQIQDWLSKEPLLHLSKDQLNQSKQAADVLVMNKEALLDESIRNEICPNLNSSQIYGLVISYVPDDFDPEHVPPTVLKQLNELKEHTPLQTLAVDPTYTFPIVVSEESKQNFDFTCIDIPITLRERITFLKNEQSTNTTW